MYSAINDIMLKHPNTIYYNYINDNRFIKDDFYNANHLTNTGAEKFTQILNDTIFKN
ncbi:MAG: hypothetical protein LBG80_00930 [Bacteroidales bacterium]|nr:hypothetical protein [Bacteroidales bacterium]